MPAPSNHDDGYTTTTSRFLSAGSTSAPRRSPSRQSLSINSRRSSASLRGSSLSQALDDDAANGRHSLAHELAVALMPEPSAGSKLLAEEFGIEYDEGAEGIDETPERDVVADAPGAALADEFDPDAPVVPEHDSPIDLHADPSVDPVFSSPAPPPKPRKQPEQDPMIILARDLEYTEKFLSQLRRLDLDHGASASQSTLEKLASDVIRRIDDSARDREGQVRELLEYEREFRKIAGEVGGNDALGQLEALEDFIGESSSESGASRDLDSIHEESLSGSTLANEWDADPDRERLGDEEDEEYDSAYSPTPVKSTFPPPPPINGPATPATTISHLAYLRTFTSSAVASLAVVSEHTQVNTAATTEAGRKIRALKNKLGGWRTEWDSAERSRLKIERWEAGIDLDGPSSPSPTQRPHSRRLDGRKLVQEQLQAFEKALNEANLKTQAIMAGAS
ncbi:predicted protein [Postia placenta Mad-698-R]|uniref:Uncharacterized protein n=1 Tax=Postia placenta MAD-698-R-SB12 TaxID=670580 RepID=A0A1X6N7F3_9APHY|nr:hypothetical protein POSPLADRAFT_1136813 [Postia placenta MAD-698-R-SB12]EED85601.1 predicted protein [Postia placenta Mad-698-R]OSX64422.1 hypothetical protein POSPLADRAFT_1136813 [Postia placenta MAD-698-R-SB12]